ncbi:MAG: cytochrome c biogenesis protein CcdA [Alphaproteobacteria bacterium]|nr:MAG: cytochrome c biogenesis protein CcdA [Alphaproteobacteria bacterium]
MGFDITYGGAALAGLLSFLSPCILPIVPFFLCYMAGLSLGELQEGEGPSRAVRRRMLFASIAFSLGVITIFVGLGASASFFGQMVRDWFDVLRLIAAAIIFVMGLHFIGLIRIGILYREARIEAGTDASTIFGAYVVGLAFAFGWTPCVGPVLAAILFTAGAQDTAAEGALLLLVYGLGMTLPFVLAALFVQPFLRFMQRFRRHIGVVEKIMGALLIVFAILIATNSMNVISGWMLEVAPDIGTLK